MINKLGGWVDGWMGEWVDGWMSRAVFTSDQLPITHYLGLRSELQQSDCISVKP
jgi:hypothetical protein